ncbi:MAG: hypothetical protein JW795_04755 [Chitinivibrionales bacterium]|nr:hypothetical protein [Chitinivibrionales bacterium]
MCQSCDTKRAIIFGMHLTDEVVEKVPHRQWIFTSLSGFGFLSVSIARFWVSFAVWRMKPSVNYRPSCVPRLSE